MSRNPEVSPLLFGDEGQSTSFGDAVTTTTTFVAFSSSSIPSSNTGFSTGYIPTSNMMTALPSNTASASNNGTNGNSDNSSNDSSNNNTLVIVLSTVLSVVGVFLLAGGILICVRCRRRRARLFTRAITPLGDDEIASWKVSREEKDRGVNRKSTEGATLTGGGHGKHESTSSTRKPPSVIVYPTRRSEDQRSPRSAGLHSAYGKRSLDYGGKMSFDKELPQTPIQARAPNAREGLTDETVPGDDPFIRRQHSRLSKATTFQQLRYAHTRTKSARSSFSMRGFGEPPGHGYSSDVELSPRTSYEYHHNHNSQPCGHSHSRVFSSSSIPPRVSVSDDCPIAGLSPRPLIHRDEIGRAIG